MLAVRGRRRPRREMPPDPIKLLHPLDRLEIRRYLFVAFRIHFIHYELVVQPHVRVHVAAVGRRKKKIPARAKIIPLARRRTLTIIQQTNTPSLKIKQHRYTGRNFDFWHSILRYFAQVHE